MHLYSAHASMGVLGNGAGHSPYCCIVCICRIAVNPAAGVWLGHPAGLRANGNWLKSEAINQSLVSAKGVLEEIVEPIQVAVELPGGTSVASTI